MFVGRKAELVGKEAGEREEKKLRSKNRWKSVRNVRTECVKKMQYKAICKTYIQTCKR